MIRMDRDECSFQEHVEGLGRLRKADCQCLAVGVVSHFAMVHVHETSRRDIHEHVSEGSTVCSANHYRKSLQYPNEC